MIRVVIWRDLEGNPSGLTVKGHAGYAPKGEDIVCSAVSALAQTAVLSLREQLGQDPVVIVEEGNLECFLPSALEAGDAEKARIILQTVETGLNAIACDYRDFIQVDYQTRVS